MGLKKIFSKDKKDKQDNSSLKSHSSRRDSTASFQKTFSTWGHKEKEKIKHLSLSSTSSHNSTARNTKRLSEPSPATSSVSLSHQLPPTRENKVTQNYDQQQRAVQQQKRHSSTNPFANSPVTSPITPSGSTRDINNIVNVLRNSISSEASLSTFASATDEEKHTQYNTSHEAMPVTIKSVEQESTNPFLVETRSKDVDPAGAAVKQEKRQSQVFCPLPMRANNDSNKYELSDDEYRHTDDSIKDAPLTPPDSAKNETDSQDDNESLYTELLAVQYQLDAVNPNNAVEIKHRLKGVNHLLTKALDNSSHLESRLKSVIETSKQTIIAISEENKALKTSDETTKAELEQIKQQHEELNQKHQGQLLVYQGLKDQHDGVVKENQELLQKTQNLNAQLDQHIATSDNVSLLHNNGKSTNEAEEGNADIQDRLKKILALSASAQLLNKQLEDKLQTTTTQHAQELEALKQTFEAEKQQHLEAKKQEILALEAAKDQQLQLKQQELVDLQTRLEKEMAQELELKQQELLALQIKMDTDAKTLESTHQAEIQALEQEQKQKQETLLLERKTESDEHIAALEKSHQTELHDVQTKLEQENQSKLESLESEHEKALQELKDKAETDMKVLEEQHQSKMQALEVKYTALITDVTKDIEQEQQKWQQKESELTSRIESLEKSNNDSKQELESQNTHMKELEEENGRFKSQIDILKSDTSDDVQKVAKENVAYKQELDLLHKEKETLQKEHVIVVTELATLTKALESTKQENLGLQSKMDETQQQLLELQSSKEMSDKVLKERIQMINEQSAQSLIDAQQQHETKLSEVQQECQQLKDQLEAIEQASKKAAESVLDENERLENHLRELEERSQSAALENAALKEEVELLGKSTSKKSIVTENQQLKAELKAMRNFRQENENLTEMVECLQAKVKELSIEDSMYNKIDSKEDSNQAEQLMLTHTTAQLGLIEYLEGENDVSLAISKFKKQLEAQMRKFASTISENNIGPIPSASTSERMR
ncbi:hypothetical protein HMPREF1544_11764 [Mucor circinelloides 1006PhL]|uniref:Uncharacterized protein n=1 Tax=Mucor circinelloides f. circinelloides (strain 1006PhL) TaxID=1220926 RepID=S2IV45_MUCC1|nr:hypothetical protein HMPREF1544_11764 [Mucor circinelloides 1006PhL]